MKRYQVIVSVLFLAVSAFLAGNYLHQQLDQPLADRGVKPELLQSTTAMVWSDLTNSTLNESTKGRFNQSLTAGNLTDSWARKADRGRRENYYVTLSANSGNMVARVSPGYGSSLKQAVSDAKSSLDPIRPIDVVRLDVITDLGQTQPGKFVPDGWQVHSQGLGFLYGQDGKQAVWLLPDELLARDLIDFENDNNIYPARIDAYLRDERARRYNRNSFPPESLVTFSTQSLAIVDGQLFPPSGLGREVEQRAELTGSYLAGMVMNSGKFHYEYDPTRAQFEEGYNLLRHAGTIYAMCELLPVYDSDQLRAAVDRALAWMKRKIVREGREAVLVNEEGEVKLGGNALATLALTEYAQATGDEQELELANKLARWMTNQQQASGRFKVHKLYWEDGQTSDFRSRYYPGEAVFALAQLYELTNNSKWLNASYRGAKYTGNRLLEDGKIEPAEHDHWLLYGLDRVHSYRQDPELTKFARRIVDAMARTQHHDRSQVANPAWLGGWYQPARYTPTSTRCEGLNAAYNLFERVQDSKYKKKTFKSLNLSVKFLNRGQIGPDKAIMFPETDKVLGGVPASVENLDIRIDYVQHALSCWLGFKDISEGRSE